MKGDTVIVKADMLHDFRRKHGYGQCELYHKAGIAKTTGRKLFANKPVALATAKRIAALLKIEVTELIKSWQTKEQAD
ncbi:MAG: hypothetical protein ACYTEL_06955 [Planctomycetota bacterium]|jgi:DNA-binding XRE family transcriptional regulator